MGSGKRWSRPELLLVLHLYERIPFGQQNARSPEVIALAVRLGRTAGSVSMKLNNLTSLDPEEKARGVAGLPGASELDATVWTEFHAKPEVVEEAEQLLRFVVGHRLRKELPKDELSTAFLKYEGQVIRPPEKHEVARELLQRHREKFTKLNAA